MMQLARQDLPLLYASIEISNALMTIFASSCVVAVQTHVCVLISSSSDVLSTMSRQASRRGGTISIANKRASRREGIDLQARRSRMGPNGDSSQLDVFGAAPVKKGMILPFQPLALTFNSMNYYVDTPAEMKERGIMEDRLRLLQDVTGAFKPGVLIALVGVNGAGKTTLMDVLVGRKIGGYIEGQITISGYPKKQETFTRISGKVQFGSDEDAHVIGDCIKHVLRELPSLPIPTPCYSALLEAQRCERKDSQIMDMKVAVVEMFLSGLVSNLSHSNRAYNE